MGKKVRVLLLVGAMIFLLSGVVHAETADSGFDWPTDTHTLVRGYSQNHGGLDIQVSSGTSVYASAGGTVLYVYSGCNNVSGAGAGHPCSTAGICNPSAGFNKSSGYCNEGFGNGVVIQHPDGSYTAYAHLLAGSVTVKPGDTVTQGQIIGKSGSSGLSTGPHLHFSLLKASSYAFWVAYNKGYATNPLPYFGGDVIALTKGADNITAVSAIVRGEVSSLSEKVTECGMYIGTSKDHLTLLGSDQGLSTYGTACYYSTEKYGYPLQPGTTYYYRVYAVAGDKTAKGDVNSFITDGQANPAAVPEIHLSAQTITTEDTMQVSWDANPQSDYILSYWREGELGSTSILRASSPVTLSGLEPGSYKVQLAIQTVTDTVDGETRSFSVQENAGPTVKVITKGADTITETGAILRGDFSVIDGKASECGMYLGTSPGTLSKLGSDTINSAGVPSYYSTAKCGRTLTPGTTYYYRAYVVVNGQVYRGEVESFTTTSSVTVTTKGADHITATSAIVRGEVASSKQKASECGMYFGTDPSNLTKLGSDKINANNMPFYYGTAKYGRPLTAGTTYYYRAYTIVGGVTYWGEVKSFTTAR